MSNVQPAPGWWRASDGNWYPPSQHAAQQMPTEPPPPKYTPEDLKRRNRKAWIWIGVIAALAITIGVAIAVSSSPDPSATYETDTIDTSLQDRLDHLSVTPKPTLQQAEVIEGAIAVVYPGVPSGKATDWATYTCSDILDGRTEESLIRTVTMRFAGGTRPDPTPAQAAAILGIIRSSGFCS